MQVHYHPIEHGAIAYGWSHSPTPQPLVVLHGLGDSSIHTYAPRFATSVLDSRPTLFIDFPGFGEGSVQPKHSGTLEELAGNCIDLLQSLGVSDAPVYAHSMGANIALIMADRAPHLARQLILAEPLLDPAQSVLAAGIAKHAEDAFADRGYAMLLRATSLQAHRADEAAKAFLPVLQLADPRTLHRAATSLLKAREPDFATMIMRRNQSSHLLLGGNSPGDRTPFQLSKVGITEVPNAGHFMIAEQSYATACAILNVVNSMHYGGI